MQQASAFRSAEQVLCDLSKAMGFSPASLEANRLGRLSADQFKQYIGRCVTPACIAVFAIVVPFLFWAALTGKREQVSFPAGLNIFVGQLLHLSQMAEAQGKISTLFTLLSILAGLGVAAYNVTRFSVGLYFDLLAREVVAREGRVVGREEQTLRPNGRDPIEKYYFDVKTNRYDVNHASYKALENGSLYIMYVLPRSGVLVAMEPKVAEPPIPTVRTVAPPEPVPMYEPPVTRT
jgi:hypothetical protein